MKRIALFSALFLLSTSTIPPVNADGLLPAKPQQVIEVVMPDGSHQQGFIKDGKFIPIVQTAQPSQPQAPSVAPQFTQLYPTQPGSQPLPQSYQGQQYPQQPNVINAQANYRPPYDANVRLDQNQRQYVDQNINTNQNLKTNNYSYNVNRQDHDQLDTVTGYGNLFLRLLGR